MEPSAHVDTFSRDNLPPSNEWPQFLLDNPDVSYPARLNCAVELLDRIIDDHAKRGQGARPAIWSDVDGAPHATTYSELRTRVNQAAHVLTGVMGLVPGNRILLRGPNTLHMAIAWLASLKAGLVVVPTMPLLRAKELKQIIDKAQVSAALCDARLVDELAQCSDPANAHFCESLLQTRLFHDDGPDSVDTIALLQPADYTAVDTAADDVCLIAFTSGTTGMPKGCMHFHRDVVAMCDLFPRHILKPTADDIFCGTPPLAFTFGLGGLLCFPLRAGASTVLIEKLTPQTLLQVVERFRATTMFTAPTFYRQMAGLASRFDLSSLGKSVSAGEALPDATRKLWRQATGLQMIDGIGSTEMIHIFVSSAEGQARDRAIGRAVPGYVVQAVDNNMQSVPVGEIGMLAVKGPTGCRYLSDPRQRSFVRDGWNLPGDSVCIDADGYVFYQSRADDMIISAGYNISGPEVESALLLHEAVAECGVVSVADDERGQIAKAFVVLSGGFVASDALVVQLQAFVKEQIAPYKYPRAIEFIDALPRTETGKLKRFALRALAAS
ncbi:AMP-binding protein [Caballeronia sordidicola]|jgi:2-aminobenzoate-CoA ligase|uniref:Acyl-coenzyme A synthetases/AMP-(Fatty) acid ligase n=1 Tax=Caballeronia sordidicola TaxID=196367 RepID=A0A226WZG8_CABSO|nr:AMP-binding protein [Caballeronia sordidicola]OXC76503.1 Acyl-coenzyme A synthetases/AMP-(fatty) acid ligase [Caballeronia sordidicola]